MFRLGQLFRFEQSLLNLCPTTIPPIPIEHLFSVYRCYCAVVP
jgi:hypothetical protein